MPPLCAVCESPTAYTLHFGGRCCKACAAFFRRTVALDLKYECAAGEPCEIHFSEWFFFCAGHIHGLRSA
uniref:Nuclear receptor domain-containing protein n=1 Tax=Caenorhabditis japonica TaxID=281687 RepID=A0A8R1INL1_CAEJA